MPGEPLLQDPSREEMARRPLRFDRHITAEMSPALCPACMTASSSVDFRNLSQTSSQLRQAKKKAEGCRELSRFSLYES